jgi:hypothetical protein
MSAEGDSPAQVNDPSANGSAVDGSAPGGGTRRARLPRVRKVVNPEARMPLMEHIRELRNRVIKAILAIAAGAIIGWYFRHPVITFLQAPYCKLPAKLISPPGSISHHCSLYYTGLFDPLFFQLKIAVAVGVLLSAPVWMYQIWAFLAPGLHARERRWTYFFIGAAIPLFASGGVIAYFAEAIPEYESARKLDPDLADVRIEHEPGNRSRRVHRPLERPAEQFLLPLFRWLHHRSEPGGEAGTRPAQRRRGHGNRGRKHAQPVYQRSSLSAGDGLHLHQRQPRHRFLEPRRHAGQQQ